MTAAIIGRAEPLKEARVFESGEKLRDGCGSDSSSPGEFGTDDISLRHRLKRQVLCWRQRRLVAHKQALDPATRKQCDSAKGFGGLLTSVSTVPRAGHN